MRNRFDQQLELLNEQLHVWVNYVKLQSEKQQQH